MTAPSNKDTKLAGYVDRVAALLMDGKGIQADVREVLLEAKQADETYEPKIVRKLAKMQNEDSEAKEKREVDEAKLDKAIASMGWLD